MTQDLEPYCNWLSSCYGLDPAVTGDTALRNAVIQRRRELSLDEAGYMALWQSAEEEKKRLLEATLVGETWFFRERAAFERLAEWCAQLRALGSLGRPLRVLVLPCATGEEAWSVAAVLRAEGFESPAACVEAIDLHSGFIQSARQGEYSARRHRDDRVDARWLEALGTFAGERFTIHPQLLNLVRFEVGNALDPMLLESRPSFDVVFCRNLLIYLHAEARQALLERLAAKLRPEGLLFLGHAEYPPEPLGFSSSDRGGAFAWTKGGSPPQVGHSPPSFSRPSPAFFQREVRKHVKATAPALGATESAPAPEPDPKAMADRGALEPALKLLEAGGLDVSLDARDHGLAGVLLEALGRREEAMARFKRALYLDPDHVESLAHLALLLDQLGRHAEAARLRRRLSSLGA